MADDDQKNDSAPDPWADILGGDSADSQPDLGFSFDDAADLAPAVDPPSDAGELVPPGPEADAAEPSTPIAAVPAEAAAPDAALDDDLVGAWLDEVDPAAAGPVGDAIAEDAAAGSSTVQIGTGSSGIVAAEELDVWGADTSAVDAPPTDAPSEAFAFTASAEPDAGASDAEESFPFADATAEESSAFTPGELVDDTLADAAVLAGAAAGAGAVAAAPRKAAKSGKSKTGGVGQIIGLVLGGLTAFPIVFGILVGLMWAGVNVPVGRSIGRALPESVAFIVPEKFRPGFKKAAAMAALPKAGSLDDLGTGGGSADEPPMNDTSSSGGDALDLAVDEPQPTPEGEPVVDDAAVVPPADGETFEDPLAATAVPAVKPEPSPLDTARAKAEFERAAEEAAAAAAAADRKPLDAAVEEALTALAAVEEVADVEDPARKVLLVDLYKTLAKLGAEFVMLEHVSADAGRPLAEAPQSIVDIHGRLGRHRDDLVRLGRNWLDYAKRPSDGVVLPVTFQASRRVGPYWSSRVTLALPKGATREITVLSRAEPAAVQGDAVVLTGMLFDGDVIWAADVRPLAPQSGGFF
jgi:hypothetical protein